MEISTQKDRISEDQLQRLYKTNGIELIGPYSIEKITSSLKNSYLVVSIWEGEKLEGFCRVISDGVYFARIQELVLSPTIKEYNDTITEVLKVVFKECAGLKSFHMNPGVYEKKEIYSRKHTSQTPQLRKIYWSIHEDEF
jgi:hypothetical protein